MYYLLIHDFILLGRLSALRCGIIKDRIEKHSSLGV